MKAPTCETLAKSILQDYPKLAVDVLRMGGYTRRAARKAVAAWASPTER